MDLLRRYLLIAAVGFASLATSCLDGPAYMQQRGNAKHPAEPEAALTTIVASQDKADGSTTATLSPSADVTQVIEANASSPIAGASVSFPPGALPGVLEISVSPSPTLVAVASEAAITEGIAVLSEGPAVAITAGTLGISTDVDFAVTLPLPAAAGLVAADLDNLVVLYEVAKGSETFVGAFLRSEIDVAGGRGTVKTRFFGKFQAVLLARPLTTAKVVAKTEIPPPSPPPRRYFARGFSTTTFGGGEARDEGLVVGFWQFSFGRVGAVGADSVLRSER